MFCKIIILSIVLLFFNNTNAEKLESIFVAPDVFITSKIKPSKDFESDRGNILFETHNIEVKKQYSIGDMLKDLPGISSAGLGNATRPIIRGMSSSRVKILQNSSSLSDVSEFGEDHIVGYDPMLIDKIEIIKGPGTLLFGNNGFAGVVNIINPLIPIDKPIRNQDIEANFGYRTSGGELKTALKFGKSIDNFTLRGSGSFLSSGAYDLANSSSEQPNSSKFMTSGGIGITYNDGENYFGISADKLEATYSVPGAEGEENMTSLNPTRNTISFKSSLAINDNLFEKFNLGRYCIWIQSCRKNRAGNNHNIEFAMMDMDKNIFKS